MKIYVVSATGRGRTLLSAWDNALHQAGIANYNIIQLSSIIPPNTRVINTKHYKTPDADFGKRLYVVKAETRGNETGKFLAAGLGWYQLEDNRGFFVEHEIEGETEIAVRSEIDLRINNSLKDMCEFRGLTFHNDNLQSRIEVASITNKPTCVFVIAIYTSEPWR